MLIIILWWTGTNLAPVLTEGVEEKRVVNRQDFPRVNGDVHQVNAETITATTIHGILYQLKAK